jgi:hypothetical protein
MNTGRESAESGTSVVEPVAITRSPSGVLALVC